MTSSSARQTPTPSSKHAELTLVQVTDSHLFANEDGKLAGMNCQEGLDAVLATIREQHAQVDCVLCTGDLVQDGSLVAYRRFYERVASLQAPQLWTPGNHDVTAAMLAALGDNADCLQHSLVLGEHWRIIMLDSHVEGQVHGFLPAEALDKLASLLEESARQGQHVLICVHHNPVPVKAAWLQRHCLKNADELLHLLDRYEHVRALVFGHVHQAIHVQRRAMHILSSPSTSVQFHPASDVFTLDDLNPGYRWFRLGTDGSIATGVERVEGRRFEVNFSSTSY